MDGGLDRDRLGVTGAGDEGQDHHVGIAVHEHVFEEDLRVLRIALRRVDEVPLDVENELLLGGSNLCACDLHVQGHYPGLSAGNVTSELSGRTAAVDGRQGPATS